VSEESQSETWINVNANFSNERSEASAIHESDFMQNEKVHENLICSKTDAMLMILMFYLRHNLSLTALDDLLFLINTILGVSSLPKSTFLFKKMFPATVKPEFHFFCPNCFLNLENHDKTINSCPKCESSIGFETITGKNFFVTMKVESQIKDVLKKNKDKVLYVNNAEQNSGISDISDGKLYEPYLQTKTVTLTLNTDGAKVFKSSKKGSLWPIQLIINELDPSVRFNPENIIICGLWFGSDPPMELFFKPLVEEIRELNRRKILTEINNEKIMVKVVLCICTADTLGKDKLQKKKQFNGSLACSYCLHPGETILKQIRYTNKNNIQERTHENSVDDMKLAHLMKTTINGFKGISPLVGFPEFNVIEGFAIDYMHCVLLGVMKLLLELWLNSCNHFEDYYIGLRRIDIDQRLLNINPPRNISRNPRSINDVLFWKANEFRNFLLYYSIPCLNQILPFKYLKHFSKLTESIFILLKTNITQEDFLKAESLIKEFVTEFEFLYGKIKMVYNIHLLTHLPNSVRNCGPLWATSNFHFENMNGILINYVNGTTDVLKQIASKYALSKLIEYNENSQSDIVSNFSKKIKNRKSAVHCKKTDIFCLLGNYIPEDYDTQNIPNVNLIENVLYYKKVIYEKNIFHTLDYCKPFKTNDSIIELIDGTLGAIKLILTISNECYILVNIFKMSDMGNNLENFCSHLKLIENQENAVKLVPLTFIKQKCLLIDTGVSKMVSFFPNRYEKD
jgi:hypothetical protein